MTAAIFGLLGVIVGGVLNGVVAYWLERRREVREAIVGARLVRHELDLIRGDFEHFLRENRGSAMPRVPIRHPAWDAHREILARVLPAPDWEMVSAGYTWIELHNGEPPNMSDDEEIGEGMQDLYADVLTEMKGSLVSLLPLTEGRRNRVGLRMRWRRWRSLRREMY